MSLTRPSKAMIPCSHRRCLLKAGALAAISCFVPAYVWAKPEPKTKAARQLSFFNTHTKEQLEICYCRNGRYIPTALDKINHIMRDHYSDEVKPIDLRLLNLLYAITLKAKTNEPLHLISGYRSPATNAMLRKRSRRVARKSLHMLGHAADIRIPGMGTAKLRKAAMSLKMGGVGHYPKSRFVHVDIGEVRYW